MIFCVCLGHVIQVGILNILCPSDIAVVFVRNLAIIFSKSIPLNAQYIYQQKNKQYCVILSSPVQVQQSEVCQSRGAAVSRSTSAALRV